MARNAVLVFCVALLFSIPLSAQNPVANFSASNNAGCAALNVQFNNLSSNFQNCIWYFGDGTSSTAVDPNHVYTSAGSYTVSLAVTSSLGQKDSISIPSFVQVAPEPLANFTANQNQACEDVNNFVFLNQSLHYDSCVWVFGDGNVSYQTSPSHTYQNPGTYTVTLVVYNSTYSCSNVLSRSNYIVVRPKPTISFTVDTTMVCDSTHQFQFTQATSQLTSWHWDFGDAVTTNVLNPQHIYNKSGLFDVTFIGTTMYGCSDTLTKPSHVHVKSNPVPPMLLSDSGGCAPFTAQFQTDPYSTFSILWSFGDGDSSYVQNPLHNYQSTGNYVVDLHVTYNNGCERSNTFNAVQVNQTPVPAFNLSHFAGCKPFTPTITNTTAGSFDWYWDFGDGTTSDQHSPSHTYTQDGLYAMQLTASYSSGCQATYKFPFSINVRGPQASFTPSANSGCPPLVVDFVNHTSGSNTWHWNFGDGNSSSASSPTHTYQSTGAYQPYLVVTDGFGCTDTAYAPSQIQVSIPQSNFPAPDPVYACAPFTIQLSDIGGGAQSWLWDFGDGTTSNLQSPTHTYSDAGTYTVSLQTQSNSGFCSQNIPNYAQFIVGGGEAKFSFIQSWCQPYTAVFTDSSTNAIAWFWEFGDGNTSTQQHPTHVYSNPGFYDVTLTITSPDSCTHSVTHRFAVNFMPLISFANADTQDSLLPMTVNFNSNTIGATAWHWDFGDGNTSNQENPVHTYTIPGPYNIVLTISNDTCSRTYNFSNTTVSSGYIPLDFGTPDTIKFTPIEGGCTPLTVLFNNPILNTVSVIWDFGDGNTSNVDNPTYTYTTPGSYTLKIYYELSNGTRDTFEHPDPINVVSPITDFSITQTGGCTGNSVSLSVYDGMPTTFLWNFGDSTTSTAANPVHTYANSNQNYTVSLLVTDTFGCGNYIVKTIYNELNANPTSASVQRACAGDTVWFSSGPSNYNGYVWYFGDGDSSITANPFHVYSDSGTYQVVLNVLDSQNCVQSFDLASLIEISQPLADFQLGWKTSNCIRVTQQFRNFSSAYSSCLWDFGDGSTSTQTDPIHHYNTPGTYTVTLTVFGNNCSDTYVMNNAIYFPNAVADFSYSYDKWCLPVTATFTDLSNEAVSYHWDFGDGTTSDQSDPVHVYTVAPSGDISLSITDTNGCVKFISKPKINVLRNDFSVSVMEGCNPLTVQFNDSVQNVSGLLWNFGDGNSTWGTSPSHTYTQNGIYDVQLIATAADGCTDTLTFDSLITVSIPTADFSIQNFSGCKPLLVDFIDNSLNASDWFWDFGDGTNSVVQNPTHIYDSAGVYDLQLIVQDQLGCYDTLTIEKAIVSKGPDADFGFSMIQGCPPGGVRFADSSLNAMNWSWNFGDGEVDSVQHPVHYFDQAGTYDITLIVEDTSGCNSTLTQEIQIFFSNHSIAAGERSDSVGCAPLEIQFTDNSINADSVLWVFGDGSISRSNDPVHSYSSSGTYHPYLVAYNIYGCHDTLFFENPVVVYFQPEANFIADPLEGCLPLDVVFTDQSKVNSTTTYNWQFGNGDSASVKEPFHTYTSSGVFEVTLILQDSVCYDTLTRPAYIKVFDSIPPAPSPLRSVDVLDNNRIKVTWQNSANIDLHSYVLMRYNSNTKVYDTVFVDLNPSNILFTVTSNYTDTVSSTLREVYTYKLSTVDECGNYVSLRELDEHSSINVEATAQGEKVLLNWNSYGGCDPLGYDIYRKRYNEPTFSMIGSVDHLTLTYTDTTVECPVNYYYKVAAMNLCGFPEFARSDTAGARPAISMEPYNVEMIRSTVIDDSRVYTEWKHDPSITDKLIGFEVMRSENGGSFQSIAIVPSTQVYLIDESVDVHNSRYVYQVRALSECELAGALSGNSSSILLKAFKENGDVRLRWTPYKEWDKGVKVYVIEKLNEYGVWERVQVVGGKTHEWTD